MADNETIADIIAEMRGIRVREFQDYADRLEAAHKRERNRNCDRFASAEIGCPFYGEPDGCSHPTGYRTVGNSAAMYAALMKVKKLFDGRIMFQPAIREAHEAVNAALAAPPRNCDVYNNESCRMAYHLHGDGLMTMQAFADWLFAPATEKEGGAK